MASIVSVIGHLEPQHQRLILDIEIAGYCFESGIFLHHQLKQDPT